MQDIAAAVVEYFISSCAFNIKRVSSSCASLGFGL